MSNSFPAVPPQIEGDSSTFTFAGQEEKVRINGSLALSCLAKGFPEPKIRWFKDGQVGAFSMHFLSKLQPETKPLSASAGKQTELQAS